MTRSATVSGALWSFLDYLTTQGIPHVESPACLAALERWAIRDGFTLGDPDTAWARRLQTLNRAAEAMHVRRTAPAGAGAAVGLGDQTRTLPGWEYLVRSSYVRLRDQIQAAAGDHPHAPTREELTEHLVHFAAEVLAFAEAVDRGNTPMMGIPTGAALVARLEAGQFPEIPAADGIDPGLLNRRLTADHPSPRQR